MSTVKIIDLPHITSLQPNTANTVLVGVDVPGDYTGQMTLTVLASGLYSNNRLVVGNYEASYPNAITTFANTSNNYVQSIIENMDDDGTSDWVAQANVSTDTAYYIDVGFTGNNYNNLNPYNSLGTSISPLDGYLYVQGLDGSKGGNLVIGTTSSNTKINFIVGGVNSENVAAYMTTSGIYSPSINSLVAANVATINSSITSNVSTINGSITANAASANAVINSRITANIATVLANTNGVTTAGALTISGMANVGAQMFIANATYDYTNTALVRIIGSTGAYVQPPANPGYMLSITGVDGVSSRIINSAYGSGSYALFAGRKGNGTAGTPTAVANNDVIARWSGSGYNGSAFTTTGQARIDFVADEDFTTANNGSRIEFYNTVAKTNTVTKIATFNANTATFTGAVYPNKGFIYTPRVPAGNQTAITLNFESDSMIKANLVADLTVSFTNYTSGKVVELWLVNTGGTNRTVTHGCSAMNSTTNSTNFTIPATSSAYLRYFSIDGDLANTFVSIQHA